MKKQRIIYYYLLLNVHYLLNEFKKTKYIYSNINYITFLC